MCRSIQTLRPPYLDDVTDELIRAAALQYVRKVAGMRAPSGANQEAFESAVDEIAAATTRLLGGITVRTSTRSASTQADSISPAIQTP
ncbi:MAG: DUF2277 domain-containing protein [Actinomycetes bacterium]|jgi:hypothetical protein